MKKYFLLLISFISFGLGMNAQTMLPCASPGNTVPESLTNSQVIIENAYRKGQKIAKGQGHKVLTKEDGMDWIFVKVPGTGNHNYYYIENRNGPKTRLHMENKILEAGSAPDNWHRAQWIIKPVQGKTGLFRISNRGFCKAFLHMESGKIELKASPAMNTWLSAMWRIKPMPPKLKNPRTWGTAHNATGMSVTYHTEGATCKLSAIYGTKPNLSDGKTKVMENSARVYVGAPWTNSNRSITGLQPNTKYYLKFVGECGAAKSETAVISFNTTADTGPKAPVMDRTWSWEIASTSAGLSGIMENFGVRTTRRFRVGKKSDLSDAVNYDDSVSGVATSGVAFHKKISGLTPNTTYYYQTQAINAGGTASSSIQSFKTGR